MYASALEGDPQNMRVSIGNLHVFTTPHPGGGWRASEAQLWTDRKGRIDVRLFVPSMKLAMAPFRTPEEAANAVLNDGLAAGRLAMERESTDGWWVRPAN